MIRKFFLMMLLTVPLFGGTVGAQIPVELFTGNEKTTLDLMFFRFFNNAKKESSPFLFFNRNRVSLDYRMTGSSYLPQFGFTEAVSYNHPRLGGFAPVAVVQLLNSGVFPKAGIQYVFMQSDLTVFSWLVSDLRKHAAIDYYLLMRYRKSVTDHLKLYIQFESLNSLYTTSVHWQFVQRLRLGLSKAKFQFGLGTDLSERTKSDQAMSSTTGLFFRYEF